MSSVSESRFGAVSDGSRAPAWEQAAGYTLASVLSSPYFLLASSEGLAQQKREASVGGCVVKA